MRLFKSLTATILTVVLSISIGKTQQTITINNDNFIDASVYQDMRSGYEYLADRNYENHPRITSWAWSHSGKNTYWRTLLYFDLSEIPIGSTINSAILYFYSDPTVTSPNSSNGNSQLSGSNSFYLEKITEVWHPSKVTWNNQPASTTSGRIWVGPSSSTTENIQLNLKNIVQDWVDDPFLNLGLKMLLENELKYRARNYASTNHNNSSIRPKLVINFTPPTPSPAVDPHCDTSDPTEEEILSWPWYGDEDDSFLTNFIDSVNQAHNSPPLRNGCGNDIEYPFLRVALRFWLYRVGPGNNGGNFPNDFPNEAGLQLILDDLNDAARNNNLPLRFYIKAVTNVNESNYLNAHTDALRLVLGLATYNAVRYYSGIQSVKKWLETE